MTLKYSLVLNSLKGNFGPYLIGLDLKLKFEGRTFSCLEYRFIVFMYQLV